MPGPASQQPHQETTYKVTGLAGDAAADRWFGAVGERTPSRDDRRGGEYRVGWSWRTGS
jgi:hypothetical protein